MDKCKREERERTEPARAVPVVQHLRCRWRPTQAQSQPAERDQAQLRSQVSVRVLIRGQSRPDLAPEMDQCCR